MKRISTTTVFVFLGAMATIGLANAQNAPQANGNAEVRTERVAQLSGADQLREAGAVIETMNGQRRQVSDLLDRARQERDIIKVNCLNDKLTQIDVTLRSAREHQDLLQTAVSINNDGQRNHEFQLMTIFRQRSQNLEAEARECIGEDTGTFDRDSRNTFIVDPNIAEQDTTTLTPDMLTPDRPLVSSPVM
ncbi:MAG: hypothetical protein U0324_32035 [Polyangiales bacterium]